MQEIILNSRPDGTPNTNSFKLVDWEHKELSIGEVLVEVQSFSLDPYMRVEWMMQNPTLPLWN